MKWTKIGKNINSDDFSHRWAVFESHRGNFVQTIPFIYQEDALDGATPSDWYDKTTDSWRKSRFNAETGLWE